MKQLSAANDAERAPEQAASSAIVAPRDTLRRFVAMPFRTSPAIRALARNAALVAIGHGGALAATLLQSIYLARALGPDTFGVWVLMLGAHTLIVAFLSFRTTDSLTAFWSDPDERIGGDVSSKKALFYSAFYTELATKLLAAVTACVFIVVFFEMRGLTDYPVVFLVTVLAVVWLAQCIDPIWLSLLRAARRMALFAAKPAIVAWVNLAAIVLAFSLFQADLETLVVAYAFSASLLFAGKVVTIRLAGWSWRANGGMLSPLTVYRCAPRLQAFWSLMRRGYLSSCLSSIIKEADVLIIGAYGTTAQVGYYRIAKSFAAMLLMLSRTLGVVVIQDFVEMLRAGQRARLRAALRRHAPRYAAALVTVATVAAFLIDTAVAVLYGPAFADARVPFFILLPGITVAAALFWVQPLAVALRLSRALLRATASAFALFCALLLISAPLAGVWAAPVAISGAWIGGSAFLLFSVVRALQAPRAAAA